MTKLYDQFTKLRDEKNSVIILGLDPKNGMEMQRAKTLASETQGLIGFKPNLKFYQSKHGREDLLDISRIINSNMIKLLDCKSSDDATTNAAELESYSPYFNCVTIAPAAGCIEPTIKTANKFNLETISMGVMSFPGVLREIEMGYNLFVERIDRAIASGTSGFVMGATAYVPWNKTEVDNLIKKYREDKEDPILDSEMSEYKLTVAISKRNDLFKYILTKTKNKKIIFLVPGFGRQGGNLEHFLESGINLNNCMINAGSDIIKAENPVIAIHEMQETFNKYRHYNL